MDNMIKWKWSKHLCLKIYNIYDQIIDWITDASILTKWTSQ